MSTPMIDSYVQQVMEQVPFALPERERIEQDVHAHLAETAEAEGDDSAAIRRMGAAVDVARGYVEEIPRTYASVGLRIVAFVIDAALGLAVLLGVGGAMAAIFWVAGGEPEPPFGLAILALPVIAFVTSLMLMSVAYFPVLEWRFGQTLGKRLMGIHVVQEDGRRITLIQAIVRRIPFFLEFFWIDAIVCLFTERKQRAFDLVARTVVTRVEPATGVASEAIAGGA